MSCSVPYSDSESLTAHASTSHSWMLNRVSGKGVCGSQWNMDWCSDRLDRATICLADLFARAERRGGGGGDDGGDEGGEHGPRTAATFPGGMN